MEKMNNDQDTFSSLISELRWWIKLLFGVNLLFGFIIVVLAAELSFSSSSRNIVIERGEHKNKVMAEKSKKRTKTEVFNFSKHVVESLTLNREYAHKLFKEKTRLPDIEATHLIFDKLKMVSRGVELTAFLITAGVNLRKLKIRLRLASKTRTYKNPYGLVVTKWEKL